MHNGSGQPIHDEQPVVTVDYIHLTAVDAEPLVQGNSPLPGHWKDGICDCFTNFWPSCLCSFFICNGAWVLAQIAQKSGFTSFQNVMVPYVVGGIICFIILLKTEVQIFSVVSTYIGILSIAIRLYIVKKFAINAQSSCMECVTGFFCTPCSIAQMARHIIGYKDVCDGDANIMWPDNYDHNV